MARALPRWAQRLGKRRVDPFTRASRDGLDLLAAPAYDMSETIRTALDAEVRELVQRLLPGAVDAYNRDALDDWIEARAGQLVARLDSEREERQAVWEALIGLAKEEATRRQSHYNVDLDNLLRAQHELDVAREALTQNRGIGELSERPVQPDQGPIRSTLGKIDIGTDWIPEQATGARAGGGQPGSVRLHQKMFGPSNSADARLHPNGTSGTNGSTTTLSPARPHDPSRPQDQDNVQTGTDPAPDKATQATPASSAGGHRPDAYADAGEIVRRGPGEYVLWIMLAATACADLAVFHQVLGVLMNRSGELTIWLAVAGFTACSLTLAHLMGRLHRDIEVGFGGWGRAPRNAIAIVWLTLGLSAFTVRLLIEYLSVHDGSTVAGADSDPGRAWGGAVLFLVLYLGSGLVAGVGAYHARNPLRDRYHQAVRSVRSAQKRLQRSQAPYERAVNVLQLHVRNRQGEEANYTAARELRLAYAQEARSLVGLLVAQHLQSPPATTGLTTPRRTGTLTSTTDDAQDTTS